jgi:hypothetical protein
MKVFQIVHSFAPFNHYLEEKYNVSIHNYSFSDWKKILIDECFNTVHLLLPMYNFSDVNGFFTLWNYKPMQLAWAKEHGFHETDLKEILFAQIEHYKPDVFYNLSPILFSSQEIDRISNKIIKLSWFASAEINKIDFSKYDARLTNLPSDFDISGIKGFKSLPFQLSAPEIPQQEYLKSNSLFDVVFFGQYQQKYFSKRNKLVKKLIEIGEKHRLNLSVALMSEKQFKFIFPFKLPLALHHKFKYQTFPEKIVSKNSTSPLFGLAIYRQMINSKVVFNCHGDNADQYRVNMRIFESLGCGAHMLSDEGLYPKGLNAGQHFSVYKNESDLEKKVLYLLEDNETRKKIAFDGSKALRDIYSKEKQWQLFQKIVEDIR